MPSQPKLFEDPDSTRWVIEADPKHQHPLVAALVLEIEKSEGMDGARECVYEALVLVRTRVGFPGTFEILSKAMALFRREDVQRSCWDEGGTQISASSWWRAFRSLGRQIKVEPWGCHSRNRDKVLPAAAALVVEARRAPGDSLARKLAEQIEQAFLLTEPPPFPPGPRRAAAVNRRPT